MLSGSRPNLLLVLSDQLRRGALACYGDPDARTPHLDELAAAGVRFAAACSSFPVCLPYRFTLMTGQRALTRGVPCTDWRMSPAETTLADVFNAAGYRTFYVGKWHLFGSTREAWVPPAYRGRFHDWEGWEARAKDHFSTQLYSGAERNNIIYDGYQTDILVDRCIERLNGLKEGGAPFFGILSIEPPHPPYRAPDDYERAWQSAALTLPANFFYAKTNTGPEPKLPPVERAAAIRMRRSYYAMIQNLDDNVGRLLAALEGLGLRSNTVVVFTSDHGQMDGAHSLQPSIKRNPYEEATGVPLIVHDPRRPERAGTVIEEVVGTEDLFPTLLGLCGLSPPASLPGSDCTPLIDGRRDALDRPGVLLYLTHHKGFNHPWNGRSWRALRTRKHMFACWGARNEDLRPWHLYDLEADPLQMNDLVVRDPVRRRQMIDALRSVMTDADDYVQLATD